MWFCLLMKSMFARNCFQNQQQLRESAAELEKGGGGGGGGEL